MYCGTGWGVCQALFLGWRTDTDADADVYCINTIDIYKRGRGWGIPAVTFSKWLIRFTSRGVSVFWDVASAGDMVSRYVGVETPFTHLKN